MVHEALSLRVEGQKSLASGKSHIVDDHTINKTYGARGIVTQPDKDRDYGVTSCKVTPFTR